MGRTPMPTWEEGTKLLIERARSEKQKAKAEFRRWTNCVERLESALHRDEPTEHTLREEL